MGLSRVSVVLAVLLGAAHVHVGICKTAKGNPATSVPAWALNEKDTTALGSASGSCNNYGCNPGLDGNSYPCAYNGYCYAYCCDGYCSGFPCSEDDDTVDDEDDEDQSKYSELSRKYRKFLNREVCVKSQYCLSIAGIIGIVFLLGLFYFAATKKRGNPPHPIYRCCCPRCAVLQHEGCGGDCCCAFLFGCWFAVCCWTPTRFGAGETPSLSSHRAQPLVDEVSYTRIARYPVQTQPPVAAVVYEPPPIEVAATIIPVSTYSPLEGPDDTSKLSIGDAQMIPERLRQWFVDKIGIKDLTVLSRLAPILVDEIGADDEFELAALMVDTEEGLPLLQRVQEALPIAKRQKFLSELRSIA